MSLKLYLVKDGELKAINEPNPDLIKDYAEQGGDIVDISEIAIKSTNESLTYEDVSVSCGQTDLDAHNVYVTYSLTGEEGSFNESIEFENGQYVHPAHFYRKVESSGINESLLRLDMTHDIDNKKFIHYIENLFTYQEFNAREDEMLNELYLYAQNEYGIEDLAEWMNQTVEHEGQTAPISFYFQERYYQNYHVQYTQYNNSEYHLLNFLEEEEEEEVFIRGYESEYIDGSESVITEAIDKDYKFEVFNFDFDYVVSNLCEVMDYCYGLLASVGA